MVQVRKEGEPKHLAKTLPKAGQKAEEKKQERQVKEKIEEKPHAKPSEKTSAAHSAPKEKTEKSAKKEKKAALPKEKKVKTKELMALDKVKARIAKNKLPVFRGRFGKKWLRRKSMKKWQKWRYPRGIDISLKKEDGFLPVIGFRTPKEIRFLHPSGMEEVIVRNPSDVAAIQGMKAVRVHATVGKKNRREIFLKAKEMGLKVLNKGIQ